MMQTVMIAPVRKTVRVNLAQKDAFDLFTNGVDRWWPRTHHPGKGTMKAAVIEPFAGGRWYHSCEDGSETAFGHVLVWQPPERLVLAWESDCNGQYEFDEATEVEVTFIAESATSTRVDLEHRHIERLGDAAEGFRSGVDGGWNRVLECFVEAADAAGR